MTFHTRASSCCHHRFHFMAGIFQRPSSICIFKTLRMAWEKLHFSSVPEFHAPHLLPHSTGLLLLHPLLPDGPPPKAEQAQSPLGTIWRCRRPKRALERVWQRWPQLWPAGQHETRTPIH